MACDKGADAVSIHGGANGSGGPKGERNGAFKAGVWTVEAAELRRAAAVKRVRASLDVKG
jgi:hypothetical protein